MQDLDPIPEEYGSLIAQLTVDGAAAAVDFYTSVFGANELYRQHEDGGERVVYCELLVGRSRLMLNDEFPERGLHAPAALGGTATTLMLFVESVDAAFEAARATGAEVLSEPEDKFWGLRQALIVDPFGHRWILASRNEDLSPADILDRARAQPGIARVPRG